MDAVDELRIPDRTLYLFDSTGRPLKPDTAADWIRSVAADAAKRGEVLLDHRQRGEGELRVYAKRFLLNNRQPRVAIAFADEIELEDKYASLFAAFGAAAVAALLLIAGGGWFLVRKSTRPVERSMEHMRRFMADAAHELRTPLTVVRTRADVALQQDRQPAEYAAALRAIAEDAERLGHIVDDLLTLARADAGQRPIDREPVYLDDVALDAADAANVVAQAKGVSLQIDAFEEAVVDGDRGVAPPTGDDPARQRHQVHAARRDGPSRGRRDRRPGRPDRRRQWRRHPGRPAAARLRAFLSRRPGAVPGVHRPRRGRRRRPGPVHRPLDRRGA